MIRNRRQRVCDKIMQQVLSHDRMYAMCPTRLMTKFTAGALSVALAACVLAWPAPARAEDDSVPLDTKILRSILEGIGLRRDGEAINYQERAPLVIPPNRTLPPPENPGAALANNPAWPKDPDVQRRKEEAALEKNKLNADETILHDQRPLRPDELTPGRKTRSARRTNSGSSQTPAGESGTRLSPGELNTRSGIFSSIFGGDKDEVGKFTGEPPRTALTEPPPGYQTPSPDQPYGAGKTKPASNTPGDYLLNHPVGDQ